MAPTHFVKTSERLKAVCSRTSWLESRPSRNLTDLVPQEPGMLKVKKYLSQKELWMWLLEHKLNPKMLPKKGTKFFEQDFNRNIQIFFTWWWLSWSTRHRCPKMASHVSCTSAGVWLDSYSMCSFIIQDLSMWALVLMKADMGFSVTWCSQMSKAMKK